MLTLASPDSRIELDVRNYQFANAARDGWDAQWLQISGRAQCPRGDWNFVDPCITTFELVGLASWLRQLPLHSAKRELVFTEPNLRFKHLTESTGDALLVHFSHEASPPWATESQRFQDGYALQIPFTSISFDDAAGSVEALCRKFPERAHSGGS